MYICKVINNEKTEIMKTILIEDLRTKKGALESTNNALNSNLENWERKEFEQVKQSLINEIQSLEYRINIL
jgi:hypothetical protein